LSIPAEFMMIMKKH